MSLPVALWTTPPLGRNYRSRVGVSGEMNRAWFYPERQTPEDFPLASRLVACGPICATTGRPTTGLSDALAGETGPYRAGLAALPRGACKALFGWRPGSPRFTAGREGKAAGFFAPPC